MKKLLTLLAYLVLPLALLAQVPVPNSFSGGTQISSSQVNANFSELATKALNRTGGTLTGNLAASAGVTIDGIDISATLCPACAAQFAAITGTTLTLSNTGATSLIIGGGLRAGTGSVGILGTDGRIPALSSTYFASLDGSNLTNINTASGTNTWSGASNTFSNNVSIGGTLGVTGVTTHTGAVNINSTSASALNVAGGAEFGSGNVLLIDTTGKIAGISSTTFASLSGANLTSLSASNLSSGTVPLARISALTTGQLASAAISQFTNDSGYVTLSGANAFTSTNSFAAATTLAGTTINGAASLTSTLGVTGATTLGALTANGTTTVNGAATFSSTIAATNGYKELGRSVAQGEYTTPSYSAGSYTSDVGTWTVDAGDVLSYKYSLIGHTIAMSIDLSTTDITGTPTELRVAIPASMTASGPSRGSFTAFLNGATFYNGTWDVANNGTYIRFRIYSNAGTAVSWTNSGGQKEIYATPVFEVN